MINKKDFNEEIQDLIQQKENEPELDISSIKAYTKPEIDDFYEYAKNKCLECITDDYYSQEYIDSFCKKIRKTLDELNIDIDMYSKTYIDSVLQSLNLLNSLKQDNDGTIPTLDEVYSMINNISINNIDSYTKEQVDSLIGDVLTFDIVGSVIMSTKQGFDLYNKYLECEVLFKNHLDNLCDALTIKGVPTPKGSSVKTICDNIYKLISNESMVAPNYNITKLISSHNIMYVLSEKSYIYIAYNDRVDRYTYKGEFNMSFPKKIPGTTICMWKDLEKGNIQIVDKESSVHVIFLSEEPVCMKCAHTFNKFMMCHEVYRCPNNDDKYVGHLYSVVNDDLDRILMNVASYDHAVETNNTGSAYSAIRVKSNSDYKYTENMKMAIIGLSLYIYIDNKFYYSYDTWGIEAARVINGVNMINNIVLGAENALFCTDNGLYEEEYFLNTTSRIYNSEISNNVYDIYVEDNNNLFLLNEDKFIYLNREKDKIFKYNIGEHLTHIYKDFMNRFVCWNENSIYIITKKE